jgi:AcrR family transcriptional regulator
MTNRDERRRAVLDRIADHILAHGLALATLRALAKAAGTSDRMLLYHFANKDEIIVAALLTISERFAATLVSATGGGAKRPPEALLAEVGAIMRGQALKPYMRMALELAALAAHGEEPYRSFGGRMADGFAAMIASRLDIEDEAAREAAAARLLALLDGAIILDALGRERLADLALTP